MTARFHFAEKMEIADLEAMLSAVRKRGTHGVILKARNTPRTAELAQGLMALGIPVVTLVTDIAPQSRLAYVGIDNRVAGSNAAYLLGKMTPDRVKVLVSLSSRSFSGEEDRAEGFSNLLKRDFPHLEIVRVSEGGGVHRSTYDLALAALAANPELDCVYSIGGGNRAILQAFADSARSCRALVAHDLDAANRDLLRQNRITFLIHHDLRQDARAACQWVLRHHRMLPADLDISPSRIMLLTPQDNLTGL
ncbi:substrate-binding domain-containing protein [Thioclava sp. FR2]|uniref:substrate-binding domain-containing protein n=1 Tax=Thioclava sp. FR2 TaxID=3445780 RepID=UPI003EBC6008